MSGTRREFRKQREALEGLGLNARRHVQRRNDLDESLVERGLPVFREQVDLKCHCGRVALFQWMGTGYCRAHKPERV